MKHRIQNLKGLFVPLNAQVIVSVESLDGLSKQVADSADPEKKERGEAALAALRALPVVKGYLYYSAFDKGFNPVAHREYQTEKATKRWASRPGGQVAAYGWWQPGTAQNSSSEGYPVADAQSAGWLAVGKALEQSYEINQLLKSIELDSTPQCVWKGAKSVSKRAKELAFEPVDVADEMSQADAWLLFAGADNKGGFVDDKGARGPLARARMFESASAAARTASAHRLSNWKVAKAWVVLRSLETFPGDNVDDRLASAIARREAAVLHEALQGATMEELRSRLAELEVKLGSEAGLEGSRPEASASAARPRSSRL